MKPTDPQPSPQHSVGPDIAALVQDDICERYKRGIEEYGVPLRPFNGRKPLLDAYQEAIDQVMYLRQEIWERDHPEDGPTAGTRSPVIAAIVKLVADHSRRLLALEAKAEQPQPPVGANTQLLFLGWLLRWLRHGHPDPRFRTTFRFSQQQLTVRGVLPMSLTLSVLQEVTADIQPVDARGNPATLDGVPVWSVSDPSILSVRVSDNGLSAVITPTGALGNAQVTVTADARMGEEVRAIVGTGDLTVVAAEASALRLVFGVPIDAPADPADAPIPDPAVV